MEATEMATKPPKKARKAEKAAAKLQKKEQRKLDKARKRAWKRARPEGASWVSPILWVSDVAAEVQFLERAFGFTVCSTESGPEGMVHAEMRHRRGSIMLAKPAGSWAAAPEKIHLATSTQYVYVADVAEIVVRAQAAGAKLLGGPTDEPWGDRCATFADPEGHTWMFATHVGKKLPAPCNPDVPLS